MTFYLEFRNVSQEHSERMTYMLTAAIRLVRTLPLASSPLPGSPHPWSHIMKLPHWGQRCRLLKEKEIKFQTPNSAARHLFGAPHTK